MTTTSIPGQVSPTNKSRAGIVAGVIVALLILAGIVYYARQARQLAPATPSADIQALEEQGTSDSVAAIEQDLVGTDLGNLDQELGDIERELGGASQ